MRLPTGVNVDSKNSGASTVLECVGLRSTSIFGTYDCPSTSFDGYIIEFESMNSKSSPSRLDRGLSMFRCSFLQLSLVRKPLTFLTFTFLSSFLFFLASATNLTLVSGQYEAFPISLNWFDAAHLAANLYFYDNYNVQMAGHLVSCALSN